MGERSAPPASVADNASKALVGFARHEVAGDHVPFLVQWRLHTRGLALANWNAAQRPSLALVGFDHIGERRELSLLWASSRCSPCRASRHHLRRSHRSHRQAAPAEQIRFLDDHSLQIRRRRARAFDGASSSDLRLRQTAPGSRPLMMFLSNGSGFRKTRLKGAPSSRTNPSLPPIRALPSTQALPEKEGPAAAQITLQILAGAMRASDPPH